MSFDTKGGEPPFAAVFTKVSYAQEVTFAKFHLSPDSSLSCGVQRKLAVSQICEFGILAARARSKKNAAIEKSSVPPRGGKTGNSCKAQQDKSVELTDCGQTEPPHRNRQRPVVVDFKLTIKPDGCIRDFSPTCALLIRAKYGSRVYESRV